MSKVDDMPGYIAALAAAAVLTAVTFLFFDAGSAPDAALCLPSATTWIAPQLWNAVAAFAVLWLTSMCMTSVNRKFNLEAGTSALASSFFLVSTAAVPVLTGQLNAGLLMALSLIIMMRLMFDCFEREDSTRHIFLCATLIAFGSMIQYAFLFMAVPVIIAAASLREISIKAAFAFIAGLATPYILMMGFGVVSPGDFHFPELFTADYTPHYTTILAGGATALTALILLLRQAVVPPDRSSRATAMIRSVNLLLLFSIIAAAVDFRNFLVYLPSINLLTGFEISGMTSDSTHSSPTPVLLVLCIIYLILYILSI